MTTRRWTDSETAIAEEVVASIPRPHTAEKRSEIERIFKRRSPVRAYRSYNAIMRRFELVQSWHNKSNDEMAPDGPSFERMLANTSVDLRAGAHPAVDTDAQCTAAASLTWRDHSNGNRQIEEHIISDINRILHGFSVDDLIDIYKLCVNQHAIKIS